MQMDQGRNCLYIILISFFLHLYCTYTCNVCSDHASKCFNDKHAQIAITPNMFQGLSIEMQPRRWQSRLLLLWCKDILTLEVFSDRSKRLIWFEKYFCIQCWMKLPQQNYTAFYHTDMRKSIGELRRPDIYLMLKQKIYICGTL